jgi:diacylglycerol kinase (ATP)
MRVLVVANQASGRGRAVRAVADCERQLRAAGLVPERLSLDASAEAWRSACAGSRGVVAVGGDGTVRSVAARLRGTSVPLAIVPVGTENLAAREFGFLRPRVTIAEALVRNRVRPCDLGVLRRPGTADHVFVVMVSAGLDADVVADVAANRRGPISHASYLGPIIRTCRRWHPAAFEADGAGGVRLRGRGQLVVANARQYAMRMDPARGADPADGMLDAVVLDADGWLAMVRWAVRLAAAPGAVAGAAHGRAAAWNVQFDRPVALQADGDPVPGGPAREVGLTAERGALTLVDVRPR